jgi:hypothetical protein
MFSESKAAEFPRVIRIGEVLGKLRVRDAGTMKGNRDV